MAFNSPKRKRGEEQLVARLQTNNFIVRSPPKSDRDDPESESSPRTYVASQFQSLELDRPVPHFQLETENREVKRVAYDSAPDQICGQPRQSPLQLTDGHGVSKPQSRPPSTDFSFASADLMPYPEHHSKRAKSPLLDGDTISDQYWHESEITGHDPDDPADDGYGINGVGFKPTAAIAWARSQKRKTQLAEYRSREAKEARDRRRERRRVGSGDFRDGLSAEGSAAKSSRVRFEDG